MPVSRDYGDTKAHLRDFCRAAWDIIEPGKTMLWNWHLDLLCEYLELITIGAKPCDAWCEAYGERQDITQLIINEPPGYCKSTIVSVMWPCWEWASRPELRPIFSSYAHRLSIKHSIARRSILQSAWYTEGMRGHWGQPEFGLSKDSEIEVSNHRRGSMQTTSTGGSVQGYHGDRIVCLCYDERVTTSAGRLPIGEIVERRLPVDVLAFDHDAGASRWQSIEAYEENPARECVRVTFSDGRTLDATTDHRVFVPERGYVAADSLRAGDQVVLDDTCDAPRDAHVRDLRSRVHASAGPCGTEQAALLQSRVLAPRALRHRASALRGAGHDHLRSMRRDIHGQAGVHEAREVLLEGLPEHRGSGREECALRRANHYGMRLLRRRDTAAPTGCGQDVLLLADLRESGAQSQDEGAGQRAVCGRAVGHGAPVPARVLRCSTSRPGARRLLQEVWHDARGARLGTPRASRQLRQTGLAAREPGDAVPMVSRLDARQAGVQSAVGAVLVTSVEPIATPERVYNIRVAQDHNYFANGVLVHNCDDPTNPAESMSEAERQTANDFFDLTLSQRVIDKNRPVYVVVMQRLHVDDLCGHVLENDPDSWVVVDLPAIARTDEDIVFPRSGRIVHRNGGGYQQSADDPRHIEIIGDLLWPEREGSEAIQRAKVNLGAWAFAGQYMQTPTPLGGGILKRDWWQRGVPPQKFERIIQSWDCAFKSTKTSDFVACVIIGQNGADRWILDVINARMDFVETCQKIRDVTAKWKSAETKLIEDKANGSAVMSALKREVTGMLGIDPEGGKLSRAMAVSPQVEAGNWHIPIDAPWASDFIEQAAAFRGDDKGHDDMVDAFTQGANWLSGGSIWDYYA